MRNSVPKAIKALVAGLVLVSTGAFAETVSRDQAFEAIQAFIDARRDWQIKRKEAVKAALATEKPEEKREIMLSVAFPPGKSLDLADEAEFVLDADATDDKAFVTIGFVLKQIGGNTAESKALRNRAFDMLLKHHITRENLMNTFSTAPGTFEQQIDAYDQIVAKNAYPDVKAQALSRAIQAIDKVVGQPMSMDDRRQLVGQIETRLAALDRDFADLMGVNRRGAEYSYIDMARESYDAAKALLTNQKIADFEVVDLDGNSDKLSNYRGKHVLLDFWATWCGPCIRGMPALVEFSEGLNEQPFEVITLSLDKDVETVVQFQENQPMPWMNWHLGPNHPVLEELDVSGVPLYILLDKEGNILSRSHYMNDDAKKYIKNLVTSKS